MVVFKGRKVKQVILYIPIEVLYGKAEFKYLGSILYKDESMEGAHQRRKVVGSLEHMIRRTVSLEGKRAI